MTTMSADQFASGGDSMARQALGAWAGGSTEVSGRMRDLQATATDSMRRNKDRRFQCGKNSKNRLKKQVGAGRDSSR